MPILAHDIRQLLLKRHRRDAGWKTMFEVSNSTGSQISGWADCIAFNLWPSRGFQIHGYEIKVSRSDWQSELNNPAKADRFGGLVDYWWIVAPKGIVLASEVPTTWGKMTAFKTRLNVDKDAPYLTHPNSTPSETDYMIKRSFAASMLAGSKTISMEAKDLEVAQAAKYARQNEREKMEREQKQQAKFQHRLEAAEKEFKERFGVSWTDSTQWPGAHLAAEKVRAALKLAEMADSGRIEHMRRTAQQLLELTDELKGIAS